jgi:hypothetical protein
MANGQWMMAQMVDADVTKRRERHQRFAISH